MTREELIEWAAGLGVVTAPGLALRDGRSEASARARLAAAERGGLLVSHRVLRDCPTLYTVTRRAVAACPDNDLAPARISAAGARHAACCCAVAALLERAFPAYGLLGEPALRAHERRRGRPLANVAVGRVAAGADSHRPDLVLLDPAGVRAPVAVEVELTVKAPRRLRAICRGWARSRHVAGVVYVVSEPVLAPLERAIEAAAAAEKILPLPLERLSDLAGLASPFA